MDYMTVLSRYETIFQILYDPSITASNSSSGNKIFLTLALVGIGKFLHKPPDKALETLARKIRFYINRYSMTYSN